MQDFFDAISESARLERGKYQMTLGNAIKLLASFDQESEIIFDYGQYPGSAYSYRGYYSDLSIEPSHEKKIIKDFFDTLKESVGKTFIGYKGGEFIMKDDTPLWTAEYGTTGKAIMDFIDIDGKVIIKTKEID